MTPFFRGRQNWTNRPRPLVSSLTAGGGGVIDPETANWFTDRLTFSAIATLNVVHNGFPFVAVTVLAGC